MVILRFFTALLLLLHSAKADDRGKHPSETEASGTITGSVKFIGEIPKSSVPDDAGFRRDLIEVHRETRGLRNVLVSLVDAPEVKGQPRERTTTVDQRDYAFLPKVVAVRQGEPVRFTNSDPANHNVRTASAQKSNEFNVYIGEGNDYEHRFVADARAVRIGCDIHPWMTGWIYVFKHSHFAVTDERGDFQIGSVPPGEYTIRFEQPDIRFRREQKIKVTAGKTIALQIEVQP